MRRYSNGAFCIDMPRGCVLVMQPGGYAVSGVKHCVRPVDMTGEHHRANTHLIRSRCVSKAATTAVGPRPCTFAGCTCKPVMQGPVGTSVPQTHVMGCAVTADVGDADVAKTLMGSAKFNCRQERWADPEAHQGAGPAAGEGAAAGAAHRRGCAVDAARLPAGSGAATRHAPRAQPPGGKRCAALRPAPDPALRSSRGEASARGSW